MFKLMIKPHYRSSLLYLNQCYWKRNFLTNSEIQLNKEKISQYLINDGVPNLFRENIQRSYLSRDVKLRVFNDSNIIKGYLKYITVMNGLRFVLNSTLTHRCKIIILKKISKIDHELKLIWSTEGKEMSGSFTFTFDMNYEKILVHSFDALEIKEFAKINFKKPAANGVAII